MSAAGSGSGVLAPGNLLNSNLNRGFIFSNGHNCCFCVTQMDHLGPFGGVQVRNTRFGDLSSPHPVSGN